MHLPTICRRLSKKMLHLKKKKKLLLFANHITDNWFSLSSSVGSYLLQGPEGVHHWPDFLLSIETQEFVHHRSHQATFPVPEKEVEEREPCYDFVLFVEFNGVHLLHLPPLERENEASSKVTNTGTFPLQRNVHFCHMFTTDCISDSQILQSWRNSLFPQWPCLTRLKKQK